MDAFTGTETFADNIVIKEEDILDVSVGNGYITEIKEEMGGSDEDAAVERDESNPSSNSDGFLTFEIINQRFTDDETFELVSLYGENECLWNSSGISYRNRSMRQAAECDIVEKLGKNGFGVSELKQKIKNLRSTYNQECMKIKKSSESGAQDMYVPRLRWFSLMDSYLKNLKGNKKTDGNVETIISNNLDKGEETVNDLTTSANTEGSAGKTTNAIKSASYTTERPPVHDVGLSKPAHAERSVRKTTIPINSASYTRERALSAKRNRLDNLTKAVQQLRQVSSSFCKYSVTEHEAFGNLVAATLNKMEERDALLAQNEIHGVLMKYRLNDEPAGEQVIPKKRRFNYRRESTDVSTSHYPGYSIDSD